MMRHLIRISVILVGMVITISAQIGRVDTTMLAAAKEFLSTLEPEQKAKTILPLNSEERLNWHFVPRARKGLPLKEMNPQQRKAAADLLRVGLSQKGYNKATTIRELETVLYQIENGNPTRDPELYYFTVFGTPSETEAWGWRYEGHHCSQNWTVVKGKGVASSPQFLGANPADVHDGPMKGTRVLGTEEDLARTLVKSLNEAQKKEAVLSDKAPRDIITGAQRQAAILENKGIAYQRLNKEQQGMLLTLIQEYADAQPRALAEERLSKIRKAGLDDIKFAWMGGLEKSQGHYYRVQGGTFLIEYDNTQNKANHIHTVWRDFKGDFGMDLLGMHYQDFPHK